MIAMRKWCFNKKWEKVMRSKYITMLAKASETEVHELVLECMNYFGVNSTKALETWQLRHFCRLKKLI